MQSQNIDYIQCTVNQFSLSMYKILLEFGPYIEEVPMFVALHLLKKMFLSVTLKWQNKHCLYLCCVTMTGKHYVVWFAAGGVRYL